MSLIEPLEARIAPAIVINNPLPNLVAGNGKTSATLDLTQLTAPASSSAYHTKVRLTTNFDTDAATAGIQAGVIDIELYDDLAPLTVQNFLAYVNNANARGDYDNTLFQRAVPNFILQGGGYEATTPATHIPVFAPVHNEADVVNRSNLAGTVAMAKTPGNPNSATSEFFINLNNNAHGVDPSTGLDNGLDVQNGGFTVFGKVDAAGLDLAKAITALVSSEGQPKQNGVPIKVVSAEVIPATANPAPGLTYTVNAITPVGTTPPGLVTASISGSKLTVKYPGNKSGLATVEIKVSDGMSSKIDSFNVEVRPNFIVDLTSDTLPGWLVPGDVGSLKVNVSNTGGSSGSGKVNFLLTKVDVVKNSFGQIQSHTDASPASTITLAGSGSFTVAAGKTQAVTTSVKLPGSPFGADETFYRVVAQVVPNDTPLAQEELFSDDNGSHAVSLHDAVNKFGTLSDSNFGTRVAVLKYTGESTNALPATVSWALKGPGVGTVGFDAQGHDISLSVLGTTFASTVTSTLAKNSARLSLARIDFTDAIGTASLGLVDLNGPLSASGGVKSLTLGSVTGQTLFSIGAALSSPLTKATLTLGNVTNLSIESAQPLASLTVAKWLDTDANNDSIVAPSLGKLLTTGTGNFEADVTLSDEAAALTSVSVGGFLLNATIATAGDIGAVKLGGISQSSVFAGVAARPASLAAFTEPHKITSFTIAGGAGLSSPLFVNSQVAAQTISTIKIKDVGPAVASGVAASGFVADVIGSYTRTGVPTKTKVSDPTSFDDEADGVGGGYIVKVL